MKLYTILYLLCFCVCLSSHSQRIYYIDSSSGNDARSGTSPETAWKTISKVNNTRFNPGDVIKFKKGCIWRGTLFPAGGSIGSPITYTSYGTGEKPIIQRSISKSNAADWKRLNSTGNIWYTTVNPSLLEGNDNNYFFDIGNIIFNHGEECGVKQASMENLLHHLDYYSSATEKRVYLYIEKNQASHNPVSLFPGSIELADRAPIIYIKEKDNIIIDGIAIRYGSQHGIGQYKTKRTVIRNCDISWIGGSYHYGTLRYGNGIQFWCNAEDHIVENNRIWQIYDAGITNQGYVKNSENYTESKQKNITYRNNIIRECEFSFELWNKTYEVINPNICITENIIFENNICVNAGLGWSDKQRSDPIGTHLRFGTFTPLVKNIVIRNNVFYRAGGKVDTNLGYKRAALIIMEMSQQGTINPYDWRFDQNGDRILNMYNNQYYNDFDDIPIARWSTRYWQDMFGEGRGQFFGFHKYRCETDLDSASFFRKPVFVNEEEQDYRLLENLF